MSWYVLLHKFMIVYSVLFFIIPILTLLFFDNFASFYAFNFLFFIIVLIYIGPWTFRATRWYRAPGKILYCMLLLPHPHLTLSYILCFFNLINSILSYPILSYPILFYSILSTHTYIDISIDLYYLKRYEIFLFSNQWMNESMDGWMNEWMNECLCEWMMKCIVFERTFHYYEDRSTVYFMSFLFNRNIARVNAVHKRGWRMGGGGYFRYDINAFIVRCIHVFDSS